jgi:hypothetical protein
LALRLFGFRRKRDIRKTNRRLQMPKQNTPAPAKPRYDVLVADEYERDGQKQVNWIRVGAAWEHDDGEGFQITLKALPLNGTLVVRRHKPKPE